MWRTWTATSTAKSVSVTFGPATHFQIGAASTTPTAGETDNLTVIAKDASNNTVGSYSGSKVLTFSEPSNSPNGKAPSYPATVTFTTGTGTAAIRLYDAQTTTVKAKEGALEGTSPSLTVKAAATKKFIIPTPSEQEAGVAFNVTLTATDEYANVATTYAGAKTLTWSGPANSPSGQVPEYPTSATSVTFVEGVGTATALKLYDAQSTTLKAKEGTIEGASAAFTIKAAGAAGFSLQTPAEQTAGTTFNVTVTALDTWHNTAKSYVGTKTLSWSGPSSSPTGQAPGYPATVTFAAGAGTASIKLYDAQSTTLKGTEGTIEGVTGAFTIKAAATKKLTLPTPSEQEAGAAFSVTLTATDEWGNLTTSYVGTKTLVFSEPASSPSGQAPEYPTSATSVTFVEGVGTATALKLYDAQTTTLKVKEGTTIAGASGSFTVKAAAAERFAWAHAVVSAGKLETGCPFACTTSNIGNSKKFTAHVSVTDRYGNIVSNLAATSTAKIEKTSGDGTLTNAANLTIPTSGLAESSTLFEYTSPASGTSEAILKLKSEEGPTYAEAEAHIKY